MPVFRGFQIGRMRPTQRRPIALIKNVGGPALCDPALRRQQRGRFIEATDEIEILHGNPGSSLDKIVQTGNHDQLVTAETDGDVAVVRECGIFRAR